ncbi:hypothetical protein TGP89_247850D, partial [Toxoplasma gondii p89]
ALLCMLVFDRFGLVHCAQFVEVVCAVVPQLFDCSAFMARAENIAKEAADAAARAEIEELQGLTGGKSRRKQSTKENETYKVDGLDDSEQVRKMEMPKWQKHSTEKGKKAFRRQDARASRI